MLDLPEAEILGRSAWSTTGPGGFRQVLSDVRAVSEAPRPTTSMLVLGEEEQRDMRISTIPCAVGTRTALGWVVVVEDVTDLRAAARMQEEGLAIVSHELRSPLATLGGLAQILERLGTQMDEEQEGHRVSGAELAKPAAGSGGSPTLLDAGHLERGASALAPETVEAGPLVEQLTETLRRRAEGRVEVTCAVEPGHSAPVGGSAAPGAGALQPGRQRSQVHPESGRVHLQARTRDGRVVLSVSDTGPGAASRSRSRWPFSRVGTAPTITRPTGRRAGPGSGPVH